MLGTSHSWISICAQPRFGVLLQLFFFPSLFLCCAQGCKQPSFLIQVHLWSWVELGMGMSSGHFAELLGVQMGEQNAAWWVWLWWKQRRKKTEDPSRAGGAEISLREKAGLGVGLWILGGSRDLLHEGAELARVRGSRGIRSMRWVCQTSHWVGGWRTLQRF